MTSGSIPTPQWKRPFLVCAVFRGLCAVLMVAGFLFVLPGARASVFNPKTFTLKNGLEIVVIENHRLPVVRQMVFYRVGAADDPYGKSGLAHYLEHLMFKGTRTVPPGEFSKIVARHGGRDNAFTTADTTAFYQTVSKENLELVMKLEADRMANLVIDPREAKPELQVVIEERRMRTDNRPAAQFDEQMANALYMNHHYRIPIIGWESEVEKLTPADARAFYKAHYAPNNAILVLAGDVTVDEVRPLVEKYYGAIAANPAIKPRHRLSEPPHRAARRVIMRSTQVAEASLERDYLAPSYTVGDSSRAPALEVLSDILGGGATSRLYRSLVIEKKLALSAGTYYDGDVLGPAQFGFYMRPRGDVGVDKVEAALDDEIAKLLKVGVTEDELAASKKRLLASAIFARDNMRHGVTAIGVTRAIGLPISHVEDWPDYISAVAVADINAAARAVLKAEHSVTGELLPETPGKSADAARHPPARTGAAPTGGVR